MYFFRQFPHICLFSLFLVLFSTMAMIGSTDVKIGLAEPAEGYQNALKIYMEPNQNGAVTCPSDSLYQILTLCSVKVPNLNELISEPFTAADIGSYTFEGMWAFYTTENYNENTTGTFTFILVTVPGHDYCFYYGDPQHNSRSLRYLGNPDPSLPGLSLLPRLTSPEETYVDGDAMSFGEGIVVTYWAASGYQNWTLYSEPDFMGQSVCLIPDSFDDDAYDGVWAFGSGRFDFPDGTHIVGSVQVGCESDFVVQSTPFKIDQDRPGILTTVMTDDDMDYFTVQDGAVQFKAGEGIEECQS